MMGRHGRMRFRRRKHPRFFRLLQHPPVAHPPKRSGQHHRPTAGDPVYGGNLTCYYSSDIDAYFDPAIGDTVIFNQFLEDCGPMTPAPAFAARERQHALQGP